MGQFCGPYFLNCTNNMVSNSLTTDHLQCSGQLLGKAHF